MQTWSYHDGRDLRLMQDLTSRLWSRTSFHTAGGLAWQMRVVPEPSPLRTQLWGTRKQLDAWAFVLDDLLYAQIDPTDTGLARDVVSWAVDNGTVAAEVPDGQVTFRDALLARGFAVDEDAPFTLDMRRGVTDLPPIELPDDYSVRSISVDDIDERVAVHRAAWEPSSFTRETYDIVRSHWPYREELDVVAVAPDGSFAACCIAWLDSTTGAAEIEPVGTHPAHRRRKLASAICVAAIEYVGRLGGTEAVIHPRGDDDYPAPRAAYASIGFEAVNRTRMHTLATR